MGNCLVHARAASGSVGASSGAKEIIVEAFREEAVVRVWRHTGPGKQLRGLGLSFD